MVCAWHVYDFKVQQEILVGTSVGASVAMLGLATFFMWRKIVREPKPDSPVGWLIWSVVSFVTLAALVKAGATPLQLLIPLSQLLSTTVLLIVTCVVIWRRGIWRDEKYRRPKDEDLFALGCCVAGVGAWVGFGIDHPMIAIVGNVAANIAGLLPMLIGAWEHPERTTPVYWGFRGVSTAFAASVFIVGGLNPAGVIPQVTGLVIAGSMLAVYLGRQRRRTVVAELSY